MKKKILIGSLLVLTLLLLMPSIPAIQNIEIEEKTYSDFVEQFNLKDLRDIKGLERLKHPFLFLIVYVMLLFRFYRGILFDYLSMDWDGRGVLIKYPLLFLRSMFLIYTALDLLLFWETISENLGWNWFFILY